MRASLTTSCLSSWLLLLTVAACGSDERSEEGAASGGVEAIGAAATGGVGHTGGHVSVGAGPADVATGGSQPGSGAQTSGGADAVRDSSGGGSNAAVGGSREAGAAGTESGGAGPSTNAGAPSTGGIETGGDAAAGTATGGSDAGGPSTGGAETGGSATGGTATGGSDAGGGPFTGGAETGGAATGGSATGGNGTGGALVGCTPGKLDETATCNTPDFDTGAPGDAVDCIGELDGRYGSIYATIEGQQYFLQVNEWGSSESQTMAHGGDYFYRMVVQEAGTGTQGRGAPTGYPSMFIGSNSGHTTANSNLPLSISAITTAPTTWVWNDNGALADTESNIFNAAYDIWFNESASESTQYGPTGGYLMVWLYDPPYAEPIGGAPAFAAVSVEGVDGTWDIWIGLNGNRPCISYVRTEMTYSLSFDLKNFIDDATTRAGGIDASWALTNVFTGFEIWEGSQNIETTSFCAFVQ